MAVIKTKASGSGNVSQTTSWEGGVKPGVGDTAEPVGTFALGANLTFKVQAFIEASSYTGTLSNSGAIECGETLAQTENIIFRLVSGSVSTWTGELILKSTFAITAQAIFAGGKTLATVALSKSAKYILEEALTVSGSINTSETASLNTNGQTVKALSFVGSGSGTKTLGASKITLTNTGATAWSCEGTLSTGTSEIILTGAKGGFIGGEKTYNIVALEAAEQLITNANTIAELKINNKGDTSGIKLQASVVHTVTTLTTNGTEAEPAKLVSQNTEGIKTKIKLTGTQTVSFLKCKDIKVETGALKVKIPNGTKEAYDLGGNEGITFEEEASGVVNAQAMMV